MGPNTDHYMNSIKFGSALVSRNSLHVVLPYEPPLKPAPLHPQPSTRTLASLASRGPRSHDFTSYLSFQSSTFLPTIPACFTKERHGVGGLGWIRLVKVKVWGRRYRIGCGRMRGHMVFGFTKKEFPLLRTSCFDVHRIKLSVSGSSQSRA